MGKSICLIPAKGCSVRLPRKNVLPLNGKPMIVNLIDKVFSAGIFDEVCVSTEDDEIALLAKNSLASVPFIRPEKLSRDPSTIIDVMLHALDYYQSQGNDFDRVCVMLPTTPFITVEDIQIANDLFDDEKENAILSVSPTEYPPFNAWITEEDQGELFLSPCFPGSAYKYTKSTECPTTYRSNGAILVVGVKPLIKNRTYRSLPIKPYIMPVERSLDIDTQFEYEFARFLTDTEFFR